MFLQIIYIVVGMAGGNEGIVGDSESQGRTERRTRLGKIFFPRGRVDKYDNKLQTLTSVDLRRCVVLYLPTSVVPYYP